MSWYYALKNLRDQHHVLIDGNFDEVDCQNDNVFCYTRTNGDTKATIIVNLSGEDAKIKLDINKDKAKLVLNNYDDANTDAIHPYQAMCYVEKL